MIQQRKSITMPTLQEYNNSRLLACDIVTGREFRRMKRKGLISPIY